MQSTTQGTTGSAIECLGRGRVARRADELAYQAVTVAAMLMLLGSLWAF